METTMNKLLNQKEVATMLGMSEAWLEASRFRGKGLSFIKIGKSVRYKLSDIQAWIDKNTVCANI